MTGVQTCALPILGFRRVVVPPSPGTFCALGCLLADLRADFVTTVYADLDRLNELELLEVFRDLHDRADGWVREQRVPAESPVVALSADMRQAGQSYDIPVDIPGDFPGDLGPGFRERARAAFLATYERVYGNPDPDGRVEIVNARAHVVAATAKPPLAAGGQATAPAPPGRRRVRHGGREVEAVVVPRSSLAAGARLEGPAIVTQYDTTTFVPPGAFVEVDPLGSLVGGFAGA